jgi:murein DD-endopeptidase MepM/ murein hydrolase activator NlpD
MNFDVSDISNAYQNGEMKPADVAQQVEAMFMEILIESMESSIEAEGGLYGDSSSSDIYRGMFRQSLASALSSDLDSPLRQQLEEALSGRTSDVNPLEGLPTGLSIDFPSDPGSDFPTAVPLAIPSALLRSGGEPNKLPVDGTVSSAPGWRRDPISGERKFHYGTDIAAPEGTPIKAAESGRVVESGTKGGYGNAVVVETSDGRKMLYAHNLENRVKVGDAVKRGEVIALVGSTGRSTGPHVHFEVTE